MKIKLNLLSFLLPLFEMEMGEGSGGVGVATPDPAVIAAADPPPASMESSSAESTADGVTVEEGAQAAEAQGEVDPLKDVPTLEELQKQAAEKVPYAQALANLRTAYEGVKPQIDEYKAFEPWKPVVEAIGDPAQAQVAHELVGLLHSPVVENGIEQRDRYTTKPFLDRVDSESPGVANQLFADLLAYTVPDENGKVDTLVRHLYRSHGLDPDRVNDYRNIDTLHASGVVTSEQLAKIPEKYHDAFKSLTQESREDLLDILPTKPLVAEETLRNADRALASDRFEKEQRDREAKAQETAQADFERELQEATIQDITNEAQSIIDSVYQNVSSQQTLSSDPTQNELEHLKNLGVIANLQSPYPVYRNLAIKQLKAVGVEPNGFADLVNRWEERRAAYNYYTRINDKLQASRALSEYTGAKQQILAKVNDYALKLAKSSGQRAAGAAAQVEGQLATATARFVPAGAGATQQGNANPYMNNPHPVGSQEYYAYYKELDKANKLNGASMFS